MFHLVLLAELLTIVIRSSGITVTLRVLQVHATRSATDSNLSILAGTWTNRRRVFLSMMC